MLIREYSITKSLQCKRLLSHSNTSQFLSKLGLRKFCNSLHNSQKKICFSLGKYLFSAIPVMFKGAVAQRKGFETLWGIFKNFSLRAVRMINEGARLGVEFPRIPIVNPGGPRNYKVNLP